MTYRRRAPTPKQVLAALIHQGVKITCYRTGAPITLENLHRVQREHLVELGLFATDAEKADRDTPEYWRFSLDDAHGIVTNGSPSTTAGSSKNRIAKATNDNRIEKFVVNKPETGELKYTRQKRAWGSRKMESRPFQKGHRPMRRAKA